MKPSTAFLAASLVANAAFVAVLALRSDRDSGPAAPNSTPTAASAGSSAANRSDAALRTALASGDLAALEAAGVPSATARELLLGRALARAAERMRAARPGAASSGDDRWWRTQRAGFSAARELQLQNRRDLSDALVAAFGEDFGLFASASDAVAALDFLPPAKRDALRRITQDYDEMMAKFSASGIQLPSDRERLKLLAAERDRDIAALLTPAEREAYELRTSRTAQNVRARYGDGIETEEDFRKIYALQKAFDEKFALDPAGGRIAPETLRQRAEAQRQLNDDLRAALGDAKYATLRRASDSDLRTVDSLVSRLNLPATTTDRIAATRDAFAAESQRIGADPTLPPPQRREQIQQLAARAKTELTQSLGAEAGEAYAQRSPWVSMLQGGMAYSTTPPANTPALSLGTGASVYPVLPAGASGPGNVRQSVTLATPGGLVPEIVTGDVLPGAPSGAVQVMTFSTSETTTTAPAGTPRVIVAPPSPPPAAPTPKP